MKTTLQVFAWAARIFVSPLIPLLSDLSSLNTELLWQIPRTAGILLKEIVGHSSVSDNNMPLSGLLARRPDEPEEMATESRLARKSFRYIEKTVISDKMQCGWRSR